MGTSYMFWTTGEDEHKSVQELFKFRDGSDRVFGIIGASMIERKLKIAIQSNLNHLKKIDDEMFGPLGPLHSFHAKINLGFMLGLYGQQEWRELVTIKDIRNKFAHSLEISSFDHQRIKSLCSNLKIMEKCCQLKGEPARQEPPEVPFLFPVETADELNNPKYRFMVSVSYYSICLEAFLHFLQRSMTSNMRRASLQ